MFFRKIFLGVDWQDWAILMVSYQLLGNYGTIPSKCVGPSMFPTIDPRGETVFVDQWSHSRFVRKPYKRGQIIISRNPNDIKKRVCKRIVATSGDVVVVLDNFWKQHSEEITVILEKNKGKLPSEIAKEFNDIAMAIHTIGPGLVWLAGDNSSNSYDSRYYGPVSTLELRGEVLMKFFDLNTKTFFKRFEDKTDGYNIPRLVIVYDKRNIRHEFIPIFDFS